MELVDLSSRGIILPGDQVGIVMAQPFLRISEEPFRWVPAFRDSQKAVISATLRVAEERPHGVAKTHFTIFPEYSLPGLEGVAIVEERLSRETWPCGTIVIGGTDALTSAEFRALATQPNTFVNSGDNPVSRIASNEWVNCTVIWIKGDRGVEKWLQPKIQPAWPELNIRYQSMFQGKGAFVFRGRLEAGDPYIFSGLCCFDWIAELGGKKLWRLIVDKLAEVATQAEAVLPLSWFFVIEYNTKPCHDEFLREVTDFFNQTIVQNVLRDRACLLFANAAGKSVPGLASEYGCSSLVFSPNSLFSLPSCSATFSNGGQSFRASTLLSSCKDVLFRERGACIHSFAQVNPATVRPGPGGRTIAVTNASVFPMPGITDPRVPSGPVPADVKWLNDSLDSSAGLAGSYSSVPLASEIAPKHAETVAELRLAPAGEVTRAINLATADSKAEHADQWQSAEVNGLKTLVETFDILRLGGNVTMIGPEIPHGSAVIDMHDVDVIAVNGPSHEQCHRHVTDKGVSPRPRRQMVLVSRDSDNNPWLQRYGSILDQDATQLGGERNITDPSTGWLHIGFRALLDAFRGGTTVETLKTSINAAFSQ